MILRQFGMKIFVYALVDPRKPDLFRYIGQTATPRTRHLQHCADAGGSEKAAWIESMLFDGVLPQMVILHTCTQGEASQIERDLIVKHSSTITNAKGMPEPERGNIIEQAEREAIAKALQEHGGRKIHAARALGIGRQTLYNKLAKYGK